MSNLLNSLAALDNRVVANVSFSTYRDSLISNNHSMEMIHSLHCNHGFANVRIPPVESRDSPAWLEAPDGQRRQELRRLDTGTWPGNSGSGETVRSYCYVIIAVSPHSASRDKLTRVIHLDLSCHSYGWRRDRKHRSWQTGPRSENVNKLIVGIVTSSMT